MLRNIVAVVGGIATAAIVIYLVERVGFALSAPEFVAAAREFVPIGAQFFILFGWFLGALAGGAVASLLGLRWAPTVWIVAATVFGLAVISIAQSSLAWWAILGSLPAALGGGGLAIRFTRANYQRPVPPDPMPGL